MFEVVQVVLYVSIACARDKVVQIERLCIQCIVSRKCCLQRSLRPQIPPYKAVITACARCCTRWRLVQTARQP